MSQISILYRLQQIDSQLDTARIALQNVEHELSDSSVLQAAQQTLEQVEKKYQVELKYLRDAENKSYDVRVKIELSEASLYGGKIQNPKELQDLQNEIASLKRLMITLEDHELEAMMAVEEAEGNLIRAKVAMNEIQAKQIEHNAVLSGDRTKSFGPIDRLDFQ